MRYEFAILAAATHCAAQVIHNQLPIGSSFGVPGEPAIYDYVIVGGGTTGLPIATRLAQDGRYSVAVIEAGGFANVDNGNRSSVPGYAFSSLGIGETLAGVNPKIDWRFQWYLGPGLKNRTVHYPRGKCLGGSSVRNQLLYQRPSKGSMDLWATEVGDESWRWENVLPYYEKSATLFPPNDRARGQNVTTAYDTSLFKQGPLKVG
jgi:choline dehydrogenase